MYTIKNLCILSLLVLVTGCQASVAETKNSNSFMITNVNIVDVKARQIINQQSVCVKNGVIEYIDNSPCELNSQIVIDGQNGYLTPGLIDMHVHMFEKQGLAFALSHGVTHVRIMNGVSAQLTWRDEVDAGEYLGSTASLSSPIISGYVDAIVHHGLSSESEVKEAVRSYHAEGYDLIKVYGNLEADTFNALIQESRNVGIPVAKHGPDVPAPLEILEYQDLQSFEHVEDIFYQALNREFSLENLALFIENFRHLNTPITPTLNIFDQLTRLSAEKEGYLNQLPAHYISTIVRAMDEKNQIKRWLNASNEKAHYNQRVINFLLKITNTLHDAGIPLLIGSDSGNLLSPHGLATHNEMRLLSEAGIDAFSILKFATINAADALGLSHRFGQIKPGFDADFIYTANNPITDLTLLVEPEAVIKRGLWLTKTYLERIRIEAADSRSLWAELKVYSEMITR